MRRRVAVRPRRPDEYARVGETDDHRVQDTADATTSTTATTRRSSTSRRAPAIDDVLVAVDRDGTVLGACTFVTDPASPWMEWNEPDETQLRLLAVDPRRPGSRASATALVEACMERARALGRPLLLHTTQYMTTAQRLYERLGFRRVPERDQYDGFEPFEFRAYRFDVA